MRMERCMGCMERLRKYPCPNCGYDPQAEANGESALPAGTVLAGKLQVGRLLARGEYCVTYLGWALAPKQRVSIVEYCPAAGDQSIRREGMEQFLSKARRVCAAQRVPNVAWVLGAFQENGAAYAVTELFWGETLAERLTRTGSMPWEQAQALFRPVLRAMEQLHRQYFLHLNLNLDNLLLTGDGSVKILDLGLMHSSPGCAVALSRYCPLEQYSAACRLGGWMDVYAMAAILFETLTGKRFPSAAERLTGKEPEWSSLPLPAPARQALQAALELMPERRTQTMEALEKGLFG